MTPPRSQATLTTFTLLRFDDRQRWWMWLHMALARPLLARTSGLQFWKLLGTGKGGGFSLRPDLNRFGLLLVWRSEQDAQAFFEASALFGDIQRRAAEHWTAFLLPTQARGLWNRRQPFTPVVGETSANLTPVAVLTRATIRLSHLKSFWAHVPAANAALARADGLLFSVGIGEMPFVRQATFSLWRNAEAIRAYAYGSAAHTQAIRGTRQQRWYAEELFARFIVLRAEGSWEGHDPLRLQRSAQPA